MVQNMINAAQNGGDFTYYARAMPNAPDAEEDKIAYSALDPNWGKNIKELNDLSIETSKVPLSGNEVITQSVEQMNQINKQNIMTNEAVLLLESKSQEIGEIINVITSIAAQTNLLALNAAIEAARRGAR